MFGLRIGDQAWKMAARIPGQYVHQLTRILDTIGTFAIFVHPILMNDHKTRWYKWRIRAYEWGFEFVGEETSAVARHGPIEMYLSFGGLLTKS